MLNVDEGTFDMGPEPPGSVDEMDQETKESYLQFACMAVAGALPMEDTGLMIIRTPKGRHYCVMGRKVLVTEEEESGLHLNAAPDFVKMKEMLERALVSVNTMIGELN